MQLKRTRSTLIVATFAALLLAVLGLAGFAKPAWAETAKFTQELVKHFNNATINPVNSNTIKISNSGVTGNVLITSDAPSDLKIDLNGHSLTFTDSSFTINGGTLEITNSGSVSSGTPAISRANATPTISVQSGTLKLGDEGSENQGFTIQNNVNNGVAIAQSGGSLIINKSITIKGGSSGTLNYALSISGNSTTTISGTGTTIGSGSETSAIFVNGTSTNGVTINTGVSITPSTSSTIDVRNGKLNYTVSSGSITGSASAPVASVSGSGILTLANGTFTTTAAQPVIQVNNGGTLNIQGATINAHSTAGVPAITGANGAGPINVTSGTVTGHTNPNGVGYPAISYAGNNTVTISGGTVTGGTGTSNGSGGAGVLLTSGNATVSGNGVTGGDGESTGSGGPGIQNNGTGTVTVESSGVVTGGKDGTSATQELGGAGILSTNGGTVTVNGGTVTGGEGQNTGTGGCGISFAGNGTVNINNGTVTGGAAATTTANGGNGINFSGSQLKITKGSIAGGAGSSSNGTGNGGVGVVFAQGSLSMSGGSITGGAKGQNGGNGGVGIAATSSAGALDISSGTVSGGNENADGISYAGSNNVTISGNTGTTKIEGKGTGTGIAYSGKGAVAIDGGTITGNQAISATAGTGVKMTSGKVVGNSGAGISATDVDVSVSAGEVSGAPGIVAANSTNKPEPTVTISGGSTQITGTGTGSAIDMANGPTVNISGGTISAPSTATNGVINAAKGTLNITGACNVNSTGVLAGTGINISGATVNVSNQVRSTGADPVAKMSSGTLNVQSDGVITSTTKDNEAVSMTSGTLNLLGGKIENTGGGTAVQATGGGIIMKSGTISGGQYGVNMSNSASLNATGGVIETTGNNDSDAALKMSNGGAAILNGDSNLVVPSTGNAKLLDKPANQGAVSAASIKNTGNRVLEGITYTGDEPEPAENEVQLRINPGNGGSTTTLTELVPEGSHSFTFTNWTPPTPTYPGHVWLGWYVNGDTTSQAPAEITVSETQKSVTVTGQWAKVNVTLTPSTQVVSPGTITTIKLATSVEAMTSGISTANVEIGQPTLTMNPTSVEGFLGTSGSISFEAPAAQPATVTATVSYAGGTVQSESGFASAVVFVADANAVTVQSSNATMGTATKSALNENGTVTLTATPAGGYQFNGWVFTPASGVNAEQATAGINLNAMEIQPLTYQGTWTANFAIARTVAVYRLYNPYLNGAHLLTADTNELNTLVGLGWRSEGQRFSEYADEGSNGAPVYRLYNPNNGDHFYTASNTEATSLAGIGWQREGTSWYGAPDTFATRLPVYRLYNAYQTENEGLGNHLWTMERNEVDTLVGLGWSDEGIAWYAVQKL